MKLKKNSKPRRTMSFTLSEVNLILNMILRKEPVEHALYNKFTKVSIYLENEWEKEGK